MIVWDVPLRVFHWALMISVVGAMISGHFGIWEIHERFGMTIIGLIGFRIIWGFVGSPTAQFRHFLTGPSAVVNTARDLINRRSSDKAGHSPLGGYATIALLALPLMMALTGTINSDDILFDGPFYHWLPDYSRLAGRIHEIGRYFIIFVIILHLSALCYYVFILRKNIVAAMITGRNKKAQGQGGEITSGKMIFGLLLMAGLIALSQWAITLRPAYF